MNIFEPNISVVPKGLKGKKILIYGDNSCGKTLQSTRAEKPLVLTFEDGLDAISGVKFMPINSWADFKKVNKQLTAKATVAKAQEMYQTIIFDEVYASAMMCEAYICTKYGAEHVGEQAEQGESRPNLYKAYEKEYWDEFNKLTKVGYTVIFIGHETVDNKTKQIIPKGDKRSMQVVRDNCTVCVYLQNNGVDENGQEILSSAYFNATTDFFARSRLTHIVPMIETFTIENLEKAISDAVDAEEAEKGIKSVSYEIYQESITSEKHSFADLKAELKALAGKAITLSDKASAGAVTASIIEDHLGKGATLGSITEKQVDQLSLIVFDLKAHVDELQQKAESDAEIQE